jgi:hypothetical protein
MKLLQHIKTLIGQVLTACNRWQEKSNSNDSAVPLQNCTREEQRSLIRLLWSEGVKPREIHSSMMEAV